MTLGEKGGNRRRIGYVERGLDSGGATQQTWAQTTKRKKSILRRKKVKKVSNKRTRSIECPKQKTDYREAAWTRVNACKHWNDDEVK